MPQRLVRKHVRLDTTVSTRTLGEMDAIARKVERSAGRRYAASRTEVLELAVDWMYQQPEERKKALHQVSRDGRVAVHMGLKIPDGTLSRLRSLGGQLEKTDGYEKPSRSREDRPNLGDTIEWCVEHFYAALVGKKKSA